MNVEVIVVFLVLTKEFNFTSMSNIKFGFDNVIVVLLLVQQMIIGRIEQGACERYSNVVRHGPFRWCRVYRTDLRFEQVQFVGPDKNLSEVGICCNQTLFTVVVNERVRRWIQPIGQPRSHYLMSEMDTTQSPL
jgi:hypothetical protein